MMSLDWKSPGSGCRKLKACVLGAFHFLQGSSSQEEAVTLQEMTLRALRLPEVTRKWSFDRKKCGNYCRRTKTRVYCAFNFLQGCGSQEEAVT